jgi:hypothetical protein
MATMPLCVVLEQLPLFADDVANEEVIDEATRKRSMRLRRRWRVVDQDQPSDVSPAFWCGRRHSQQEDRVLGWVKQGRSNRWIGIREGKSEKWVEAMLKGIRDRVGFAIEGTGSQLRQAMIIRLYQLDQEEAIHLANVRRK